MVETKFANVYVFDIDTLNGIVLINIPAVFFSLKFNLFSIGVPITNSGMSVIPYIYIAKIAIKKLNSETL